MSKKISDGNYIVVENVTYIVVTYEIGYRWTYIIVEKVFDTLFNKFIMQSNGKYIKYGVFLFSY
jgi:hypothetical protein